ncbi:probable cytochrome P450 9f2 [Phlebotomus argentipes]|uniref:probable cytochrome P450 9f2 n=1 Tax=Phlebotomus argentipes TaxID=94469 RepID=UPI0028931433|nr:probable cytochrome P450 9f2 [Phlebotomus argentipes]
MYQLLLFIVVVLLTKLVLDKGYHNQNYFKDRGVKFLAPTFMVGCSGNLFTRKLTLLELLKEVYSAFPQEKFFGSFEFRTPVVVLRDPELIKYLAVKEFDNFSDRRDVFTADTNSILSKTLFLLKGNYWRAMRATLSPAFTGSKMRLMFELISECSNQMVAFVNKETKEKGIQTYEMKDFCSRMSNDIIATCAFGIQVNSLEHRKNKFFEYGSSITNMQNPLRMIRMIICMFFPKLANLLRLEIFPDGLIRYFKTTIIGAMDYREKNNIIRPDMIHLLMEAKKGRLTHQTSDKEIDSAGFATVEESQIGKQEGKKDLSDDDILAQCFLFFIAGFEPVSTALSFLSYEMAVNPEIQEKLYKEIRETDEELRFKSLNYDVIQKMKYLDMVVSEHLRMWPPVLFLERICTKAFTLDDGNGLNYKFSVDDKFVIPTHAIQHDAKYFPDPEKFDPERFSDENKGKIIPGTYLPFGIGPRNCIGSRFGLMEVKAILYYLILNFKIEPTEKTQIPLKISKNITFSSEKGIRVQLTPRLAP